MVLAQNRFEFCSKACKYNTKRYKNSSQARAAGRRRAGGGGWARELFLYRFLLYFHAFEQNSNRFLGGPNKGVMDCDNPLRLLAPLEYQIQVPAIKLVVGPLTTSTRMKILTLWIQSAFDSLQANVTLCRSILCYIFECCCFLVRPIVVVRAPRVLELMRRYIIFFSKVGVSPK